MAAGEGFEPPAQAPGAAPGLNLCEGPNPYERTMAKRKDPQLLLRVFLAAGEGFEPSHTESESAVLPLHNPAMFLTNKIHYTRFPAFVNTFFPVSEKIFRGRFGPPPERVRDVTPPAGLPT